MEQYLRGVVEWSGDQSKGPFSKPQSNILDEHSTSSFHHSPNQILCHKQHRAMTFVLEALSVALISAVKLTAWWLAFNWLRRY